MTTPKPKLKWTIRLPGLFLLWHCAVFFVGVIILDAFGGGGRAQSGPIIGVIALEIPAIAIGYPLMLLLSGLGNSWFRAFGEAGGSFLWLGMNWVILGVLVGMTVDDVPFSWFVGFLKRKKD